LSEVSVFDASSVPTIEWLISSQPQQHTMASAPDFAAGQRYDLGARLIVDAVGL
jgi:hypothetical protein